jgi:hypothetical protein
VTGAASYTVGNGKSIVCRHVLSYEIKQTMLLKYGNNTFNNDKLVKFNIQDSEFLVL